MINLVYDKHTATLIISKGKGTDEQDILRNPKTGDNKTYCRDLSTFMIIWSVIEKVIGEKILPADSNKSTNRYLRFSTHPPTLTELTTYRKETKCQIT